MTRNGSGLVVGGQKYEVVKFLNHVQRNPLEATVGETIYNQSAQHTPVVIMNFHYSTVFSQQLPCGLFLITLLQECLIADALSKTKVEITFNVNVRTEKPSFGISSLPRCPRAEVSAA